MTSSHALSFADGLLPQNRMWLS